MASRPLDLPTSGQSTGVASEVPATPITEQRQPVSGEPAPIGVARMESSTPESKSSTPGPWRRDAGWIVSADSAPVAFVDTISDADLNILLAAPDLLAALKAALEQTEDGLHQCDQADCWVDAANRAIARAEGRS